MSTASTKPARTERTVEGPPEHAPLSGPRLWRLVLLVVFVVAAVAGTVGLVMRFTQGHLPAGYGSYVPWGLWIAVYFHGVGIAAGVFAATAVGYLLRLRGFADRRALRLAAVVVAATVGPALLAVGLDLGQMTRAWRIVLTPSFTSMMAFNTWVYIALLAVSALVWWLSYRPDRGWLRPLLVVGLLISVAVPSQSGAFLGVVDAKPYWHSALLPILLLVSAMTAGVATLMVVRAVVGHAQAVVPAPTIRDGADALHPLRRALLAGLALYFFLEFAEFSIVLWNPNASAPEISLVLTGPYWWVFWLVHVLAGGIIPAALLLTRRRGLWVAAAAMVAVAFISTRLNVLIPGQALSEIDGLQEAYYHPRLDHLYEATLMEYLVTFFCLALGMAVLYVGWRLSAALERRLSRPAATPEDHR